MLPVLSKWVVSFFSFLIFLENQLFARDFHLTIEIKISLLELRVLDGTIFVVTRVMDLPKKIVLFFWSCTRKSFNTKRYFNNKGNYWSTWTIYLATVVVQWNVVLISAIKLINKALYFLSKHSLWHADTIDCHGTLI